MEKDIPGIFILADRIKNLLSDKRTKIIFFTTFAAGLFVHGSMFFNDYP